MPAPKPSAPPAASMLDTSLGNATSALYSAAIGPISIDYYLPIFTRFEEARRPRLAWNWAACLYTVNWMIFRGLGLAALAYCATVTVTALLLFGLGRMLFQFSTSTELVLLTALVVLAFGIPGFLGNRLLHAACRKKMVNALRESATLPEACALLALKASSRKRFLWLVSVNASAVATALALYGWGALRADDSITAGTSAVQQAAAESPPGEPPASSGLSTTDNPLLPSQSGLVTELETPLPAASQAPAQTPSAPQPIPTRDTAAPLPLVSSAPSNEPVQTTQSITTSAAPSNRQRFYINVGLFAKETNAQNALNKLEKAGLSTLSSSVSTSQGDRTRVRAGPYNSEREANAAAKTIRSLNLDAVVMKQTQ